MIKKSIKKLFLSSLIWLMGLTVNAYAKSFNMTLVTGHPAPFRWVKSISEYFVPTVTEKLQAKGYTVNIMEQYGGTIAKVGEELEIIGQGIAEAGTIWSLFDPAKLAVQNVTYYTPFVSDDIFMMYDVMEEMHKNDPDMQRAYTENNVIFLGSPYIVDDYLLVTNFPINSMDDLKGRKIGTPGAAVNWLNGIGAVGVSGNLTTYYNSISTGVFDGAIVFASSILPGKFYEVAPYVTKFGLGAQFAGGIGVNADWFNGLPYEVQQILTETASETGDWYNNSLEAYLKTVYDKLPALGAKISEATPEMRKYWATNMQDAAAVWTQQLDAQGKPATKILDTYMSEMRNAGATPLRDWDK